MPPRSTWKGFLRLSLVSVPVKAFTATATGADIRLRQLHKECNNPIKYKKSCPLHGELAATDIVSGYEYSSGQFVVVEPEEIDKLRTKGDRAIGIDGFIKNDAVDPVHYSGRTYYLAPDGPVGQRPYALLYKAMTERGLHAVAQVVVSGKEQLVLVRPYDGILAMSVLQYASKVKSADAIKDEIVETEVTDAEYDLAEKLIEATYMEEFDLDKYKDKYTENLSKVIEAKVDGKEIVAPEEQEEPRVINLIDALKQSVEASHDKKMAGSARKTKAKGKKKSG